jgi:hypothetical protein
VRRLAVLVPYRDRAEHLEALLPPLTRHLEATPDVDWTIHVVEQLGDGPFNKGKLLNSGFRIAGDADYYVFHDVDYVPLEVDYGWCEAPTRLIWHGLVLKESHESFFGAVVAMKRRHFELLNGFSNGYWGWGCEDVDLRIRCQVVGLPIVKRDGTFRALPHKNRGFVRPGVPSAEARETRARLEGLLARFDEAYRLDGLSTLAMRVEWSRPFGPPRVQHHGVRLDVG